MNISSLNTTNNTATAKSSHSKPKCKHHIAASTKSFKLYDCQAYDQYIVPELSDDTTTQKQQTQQPRYGKSRFCVELYGINEIGERCIIFVTDMMPYFYVKIDTEEPDRPWTMQTANNFAKYIAKKIGKFPADIRATIVHNTSLSGFNNQTKHQFVRLEFDSQSIFKRAKNLWYAGEYRSRTPSLAAFSDNPVYFRAGLELYESSMLPLLRFFHLNEISPTGWVEIDLNHATSPSVPLTSCEYEYETQCKYIHPQPNKI